MSHTAAPLRTDAGAESVLFATQVANTNRPIHLRTLRDETRRLRRALEAERTLRRAR